MTTSRKVLVGRHILSFLDQEAIESSSHCLGSPFVKAAKATCILKTSPEFIASLNLPINLFTLSWMTGCSLLTLAREK